VGIKSPLKKGKALDVLTAVLLTRGVKKRKTQLRKEGSHRLFQKPSTINLGGKEEQKSSKEQTIFRT